MRKNKEITICAGLFIVFTIIIQVGICSADSDKYTVMKRIQKTVQIINQQKEAGALNPFEIMPLMQKVQKNFKAGNLKRADKLLDEVNRKLGGLAESDHDKTGNLQAKVQRVQAGIKEWQAQGRNLSSVRTIMQKFKALTNQKKFDEAETVLDRALKLLGGLEDYEKIIVVDLPPIKNGIADPSLEYADDGIGWMAYSHVDFKQHFVSTYLAKSYDNGKTWKHVQIINQGGASNKETSTLVYDPDDLGKEWKLFYFEYIRTPKGKRLDYSNSWISYKYASDPEGTWSSGIPVLGPPKNRNKGIDLVSLHPDLEDFVFVNELGSIYKDGIIYLSMEGAASPTGAKNREKKKNILLSSSDHGKTWKYVGILTDNNDAKDAGYLIFTASSLVEENGRLFLFVSPSGRLSNPMDKEGHHDGTHIFEFKDITKAKLKRDNKGKLILIKHIDDNLEKGGQADYDEQNTYGGIVIPQQDLKYVPEVFQLFSTKEKIVD